MIKCDMIIRKYCKNINFYVIKAIFFIISCLKVVDLMYFCNVMLDK